MKRKLAIFVALVCSLLLTSSFALAANQANEQERIQEQEHIYGSQMMTEQERNEYRAKMQAAKTNEEREQIRMEHHERMRERAKSQGLSMPDTPPPRGGSMGGGKGKHK
ncbi:MAG: hypothetical protein IH613_06750 [Desulfuromonadales bacterium]|nr:hypothetical protein [Desulfuromonadales bacterium]